jgi:predicted ATP-grasp superfamily ATP-dependent carboligase
MTPANAFMPDPEGAAVLIDTLNTVYGFEIDTYQLLKDAKNLKTKLLEIAQHHQRLRATEERRGLPGIVS